MRTQQAIDFLNSLVDNSLIANLDAARAAAYERPTRKPAPAPQAAYPLSELDFSFNVANALARKFYELHGVTNINSAFELGGSPADAALMTTRHCIRRELGACLREPNAKRLTEPLTLEHAGRRYRLEFDCAACLMRLKRD